MNKIDFISSNHEIIACVLFLHFLGCFDANLYIPLDKKKLSYCCIL